MENLFPDIHFLTTVSQGRLSSKHIDTTCLTAEVNQAAVRNTNFCISGSFTISLAPLQNVPVLTHFYCFIPMTVAVPLHTKAKPIR